MAREETICGEESVFVHDQPEPSAHCSPRTYQKEVRT